MCRYRSQYTYSINFPSNYLEPNDSIYSQIDVYEPSLLIIFLNRVTVFVIDYCNVRIKSREVRLTDGRSVVNIITTF